MAIRILSVDDEQDMEMLILQLFRKQIREKKYEFVFANNGIEALERLEESKDITLILSDINMPGMSGLDLLKNIKKNYDKPAPIVMMITAYGDEENYNEAMSLGADDFLTKPVDFNMLKEKLKNNYHD